jgi:hypothetical protein
MKKKLLQTCLFLTLFGLLLITPIGRVLASTEGNLKVINLAGTTVNYTYDQLMAMPKSNVSADLNCYGAPVTSGNWSGVSLSYLLQQVGMDPAVSSIDFLAQDGYAVNIPLQVAMQPGVIIAYEVNGSPLSEGLRLVVPGANGNIWIALITSITMSTSVISVSQSVAGNGIEPPTDSTGQSSTQQQEPVQTQPTTPKNENSTEPVVPPANVTQPAQKASTPPESSPEGLGFPVVVAYAIALGATVALVAVGYFIHKDRRGKGKLAVVS